jgi:hypothetical protein
MGTFQNPRTGQFADIDDVELAASAARTATGQGAAVALGDRGTLRLLLDVTAASGTLDVTVETSFDGATGWRSLGTFAQKTAVASERKSFSGCDRYVRATWTVGGTTPSFTFSVVGEAV